jgi:hypothetical protein
VGWLVDFSGSMDESLATAWALASGKSSLKARALNEGALDGIPSDVVGLPPAGSPATDTAQGDSRLPEGPHRRRVQQDDGGVRDCRPLRDCRICRNARRHPLRFLR